ncbi:(2Fe-2S)-binding protein [Clostridium sp. AM58-1XD]|uniref:(2Fe-2S)-binding protein n=1 Tax=Clostridium sp. AM58-1XD TaxID=2292307 RepID=UPI000E488383|nr:(2Fe-2S)-binding protein [Clostridium sp. AM58-1XD]RGY98084.1 (2Fe-2S)-binding protein [Clostridium sp. AM58-1XD]
MNLDKIVCSCMSVTNGMIKDAVDSGATTLEEVQEITGAGTVCGVCLDDIQHLVDEFVAEKNK